MIWGFPSPPKLNGPAAPAGPVLEAQINEAFRLLAESNNQASNKKRSVYYQCARLEITRGGTSSRAKLVFFLLQQMTGATLVPTKPINSLTQENPLKDRETSNPWWATLPKKLTLNGIYTVFNGSQCKSANFNLKYVFQWWAQLAEKVVAQNLNTNSLHQHSILLKNYFQFKYICLCCWLPLPLTKNNLLH